MSNPEDTLPTGWTRRRLGDVLKLRNGYPFKPTEWADTGRAIIRIQNLKSESAPYNHYNGELKDQFKAKTGDLLFAWSGTPGTSFGAHVWEGPEAWINQHIFRVDFSDQDFDRDFLKLAFNHNLDDYIAEAQGGVGLAHITKAKLNESLLIAPPINVQRSIARLIGDHNKRQSSALEHLSLAKRIVERLRQTILVAGCTGRLTADWREENPSLAARVAITVHGEVEPLAETPAEWVWVTLKDVADLKGGVQKGGKFKPGESMREVPYLRVANVQRGWLDLSEVKTIVVPESKITELRLQHGDILFNEGGDRDKLGRGWIWEGQIDECIHQNHVFRARLRTSGLQPQFYSWFGNTIGADYFIDHGKQTVNLASLNMSSLKALPVPVPSDEEQAEIVSRVEALLALADSLKTKIESAQKRVERSSQAVLAKTFRGDLPSVELSAFPVRAVGAGAHR